MTITTDGGTMFTVKHGKVTIALSNQPECTIPLADLQEFLELYIDNDDDFEDEE